MTDPDALPARSPKEDAENPEECGMQPEAGESTASSFSSFTAAAKGNSKGAIPPPPGDAEILRLRELLFSREIAMLDCLEERLNAFPRFTTESVSEVIAEAIHLRADKDPGLSMALDPVVDGIVKKSLHTRRNEFVNALFPLMGPTIRKSIAESFRSMLGSFSKSVEMAFSWRGIRWRFEALRSGKPFSEIVMLNTLVYRVEQLFFIHSGTGLVLSHLVNESVLSQDADMVSAMLTAVQDFARDCFAGGKDEALETLQLGEFTIYIETAPQAYLACVLRGTPPGDFRAQMRATLELMLVEYADALDAFNGDTEPFTHASRYLEPLMLSHYTYEDKKLPLWAKLLPLALLLLVLGGGGYVYYTKEKALAAHREFTASMHSALGFLRAEPGLMVANVNASPEAPWELLILKDALSRTPEEVLRAHSVNPGLFDFKIIPFMSYDPSIVVRRVRDAIQPPPSVAMRFDDEGTLTFTGTAPMSWIVATREDARSIPGVERVDLTGVRDPRTDQIAAMVREVESAVIEFPFGKDTPVPADAPKLKKAIDTLVELEKITIAMGFSATLTVYGHADTIGNERRNYEVSQARARTVAAMLYARGSSMPVATYGMGAAYPKEASGRSETAAEAGRSAKDANQINRRIELRVHFSLSPSAQQEMFRR